jgi:ribose transport system ATP-binding protein
MAGPVSRLAVRGVHKQFGATQALSGVDLEAEAGEVHAVVGENGAGKSTLMAVLAGALRPDSGTLSLEGRPYSPSGPLAARQAGVGVVYQEPQLCPHLTVAENLVLGDEPTRFGLLDRARIRRRAEAALAEIAAGIDPSARVSLLPPSAQQMVEIARALAQAECRVLILDEPTSRLGADETARLFGTIRRLRDGGTTVLYVSHFLEELRAIADRFTVLRDGRTVGSGRMAETSPDELVSLMAGRRVAADAVRSERTPGEVVLAIEGLAGDPLPRAASLELRRGEVLGIAGLVGSGRTELLRAIFGLDRVRSGRVRVHAVLGLLSEDRKGEGLALGMSVADNITLSRLDAFVLPARQRAAAERWVARLGIRSRSVTQPVVELSGGNQQKVALARLLHHDVDVALLDEPTRGIDVASRADVYRLIDELALGGKAVLVVSSSLPELLGVCDRVAVMHRGVLGAARPIAEASAESLLREATGA